MYKQLLFRLPSASKLVSSTGWGSLGGRTSQPAGQTLESDLISLVN